MILQRTHSDLKTWTWKSLVSNESHVSNTERKRRDVTMCTDPFSSGGRLVQRHSGNSVSILWIAVRQQLVERLPLPFDVLKTERIRGLSPLRGQKIPPPPSSPGSVPSDTVSDCCYCQCMITLNLVCLLAIVHQHT